MNQTALFLFACAIIIAGIGAANAWDTWAAVRAIRAIPRDVLQAPQPPITIIASLVDAGKQWEVPWQIMLAVAWQESHFQPDVGTRPDTLARGLMQITPIAFHDAKRVSVALRGYGWDDLNRGDVNAKFGAAELAMWHRAYEGDWSAALEHYGASPIYAGEVLTKARRLGGDFR